MAELRLDRQQLATLQSDLYNNRHQTPIPQLIKLLQHELELVNAQILEVVVADDLRILQGEGRRIKKILGMFERKPLAQMEQQSLPKS